MKNYYELLEIEPSASPEDVKRAFRLQIARYHPDKVQHLGKEFQDMAAGRAAELTEAYRILSDEGRRAEYDRVRASATGAAPPAAGAPPRPPERHEAPRPEAPDPEGPPPGAGAAKQGGQFTQERATRDEFVRKATIGRFRQAFDLAMGDDYNESPVKGFDIAYTPKSKLFTRNKGPRLLGRFVSRVDAEAVADAWVQAGKSGAPSNEEVCVFLMGPAVAPPRELADAIAKQRRQSARGAKVTVIPVDARDWDAHVPTDAPVVAKNLLARLRKGT